MLNQWQNIATGYTYDVENRLVVAAGARNGAIVYDPLGRIFMYDGAAGRKAVRFSTRAASTR